MTLRTTPHVSPNASILRHRATALRAFAGTVDQLLVTRIESEELSDHAGPNGSKQWYVRRQLLDHNLHQLHRAADELREVAHQMWQCADDLDLAHGIAMAPGY